MKCKAFSFMLCILVFLLAGCQASSTRTVVMKPDIAPSDQGALDGTLKGIRSFPTTTTISGKPVSIAARGFLDATHLWCETSTDAVNELCSTDDSFGFVKKFAGTNHQMLLGTSPNGRYAVFTAKDDIKTGIRVMLFNSTTEQFSQIVRLNPTQMLRSLSLNFTQDGRYMSFLVMEQIPTSYYFRVYVYDLQTKAIRDFILDGMYLKDAYTLQLTQVKSINEMSGWMLTNQKGLGDAIFMNLMDGKAFPASRGIGESGMISDIMGSCKEVIAGKGLLLSKRAGIDQNWFWYDTASIVQTMDGKMVAVDLRTGDGTVLAENIRSIIFSASGKRAVMLKITNGTAEVYTARIKLNTGMPELQNMRLVYTGKGVSLCFWNQDESKFVLYETDEKDYGVYYRVLTLNTTQQ